MIIPIVLTIGSTFFQENSFTFEGYMHFSETLTFENIAYDAAGQRGHHPCLCGARIPDSLLYFAKAPRRKGILLALAIFPLLTSPVVRSFSWMIILGRKGLINNALVGLGIVDKPLDILYTPAAMMIGLTHLFLPLMIISLVGA